MSVSVVRRGLSAAVAAVTLAGAFFTVNATQAHVEEGAAFDLNSMSRRADLVFTGRVTEVRYRNSEPGGATNPVDGSDLPHTFVTFAVESVFKGKVEGRQVVLRFLGGVNSVDRSGTLPDEEGPATEIFGSSLTPLFDVGDRDLLFVRNNTVSACPLVNCAEGRFRLLSDGPRKGAFVYTDRGEELRKTGNRTITGPPRPRSEVLLNRIGPFMVSAMPDPRAAEPDSVPGARFTENRVIGKRITEKTFAADVEQAVRRTHSREELANLRPIATADPTAPFTAGALRAAEVREPDEPERVLERPWLDDLSREDRAALEASEEAEATAFDAADGNPVLPPGRG